MNVLQSIVTPITHNIPSFLRQPAEALIGEKCYAVLVYDFDITDAECLKYALSKGLGMGIVVGGGIVKIPQILTIVRTGSARGLSLSAYILETTSYAVSLAYASRNHFPFSTYGENFFLTIQNVIITLLILYLSSPKGAQSSPLSAPKGLHGAFEQGDMRKVVVGIIVTVVSCFVLWSPSICPPSTLSLLQAATLPISLLSKAPQILQNHRAKSTGNLSAFAVFNALLGCLARIFTTWQEVNDPLIFWGFAGAAVLNLVLAAQMIMYWKQSDEGLGGYSKAAEDGGGLGEIGVSGRATSVGDTSTGSRRWSRKLD